VFVFPKLVICLKCGFAELIIPERELRVLQTGTPVEGAVVSEDKLTGGDDVLKKPDKRAFASGLISSGQNVAFFLRSVIQCPARDY
jgi:hypothetical protein